MTDVRAPESDPFDPSTERDDLPRPGPGSAGGGAFGLADWLKWAWRQLTSMRIALILLFLLAVGTVPGSVLPQQGADPAAVQQYYVSHPDLAPWLNRLGLFNVFAAPWFAAIYLLLFASLIGCVVPRTFRLAGSTRSLPPRAPRNLSRLPRSAEYVTTLPPAAAAAVAAKVLSGHGFRLRRPAAGEGASATGETGPGNGHWVSAEKGYLREAGNLLFHLALLGLLVSVALGGLFGYKADRLLVQGQTFADTTSALDEFHPGRFVTGAALGQVVYDQATPFVAGATGNFLSEGVVKVPDAQPDQLGFTGVFVPTAANVGGTLESVFPAADNPVVSLIGYAGNLGENAGPAQSVYELDTAGMKRLTASPQALAPGQSLKLPGDRGTITFTGYVPWVSLAITHDPGQLPALICGMAALGGLLLSFMIRRRRVFVRARASQPGAGENGTTVQVGGLARTDASGSFEAEFAALAAELKSAHEQAAPGEPAVSPQPEGE